MAQLNDLIVNGVARFLNPIQGNLNGNAATATSATSATSATTATKATQDESGNNIKASYAASFSISDHTITLKNKNGTSLGTVTVPDNNTTYTLGTSSNNVTLTPAGGTAQSITVPYATSAGSTQKLATLGRLTTPNTQYGDGAIRYTIVSSSMTTDKPNNADGHLINLPWDNSGGYDSEIYLQNNGAGLMWIRGQSAGTWKDWKQVGVFTETPTTGQVVITDGATGGIKSSGYTIAKSVPSDAVFTDHTYNFGGTTFYSGNNNTAEHNCNSATYNGHYYYTSNGPATAEGASSTDGALFVQAYSTSWVGQIAQDYRNGKLQVRGLNNGTWYPWLPVMTFEDTFGLLYTATKFKFNGLTRKIQANKSTSAWDSQVYSSQGYAANCYVTFKPSQTNMAIMMGLDANPTEDANYNKIDYCWYIQNDGKLSIFESGSSKITAFAYAVGDDLRIEYDGVNIRYIYNGVIKRTVARAISGKLYMDSSFHGASGAVYDFDFGAVPYNTTNATLANTVYGIYTGSGGKQGPSYYGKNCAGFLMSNETVAGDTHYKNWLYMDNYNGTDVGGATAIGVDRSEPRLFIMQSDANRTSWNNTAACGVFTATPTTGQVVVTDGTTGGIKSSGYTIAKSVPSNAVFTDNNNAVTQTATTTSSAYEILFSATADNTTRTEGARKNSNLTFNPSSGLLKATNYMSWDGYYSLLNSDGTKHWVHIGNGGSLPGGSLSLYDSDDTARINLTANDGVIKANKMQMTTTAGTNKAEFYVDDESNGRMYLYNSSGTSTIEMTGGDGLINLSGLKSGNDTITVSKMLATAFKSSIAVGSYEAQATTIPNLLTEIRYSNGCCGSVSIGTAYAGNPDTVATGWYNFIWIPHRTGGKNGAANGDNTNYGRLLLFGMTVNNEYTIRYSGGSITYCRRFLMANGVNYSTLYSGSLTNGNQTSVANGYGTYTGYLVIGTLTGTNVRSCVYVPKANLTTSTIRYQYADESDYRSFQMWYSSSTLYVKSDAGSNASGAVKYVYGIQ